MGQIKFITEKILIVKAIFFLLLLSQDVYPQTKTKKIYAADFSVPLNNKEWIAEIAQKPGFFSNVYTQNNTLVMNTHAGVTVWLNTLLKGNIRIEYDRQVLVDTGRNDRLSDCNQFWMASDPHQTNLFTRNGQFESYDNLQLYYVGMGGNQNTTTRFRKYESGGTKPVIKEYLDPEHLLKPNRVYHIRIEVTKGVTSYWVDGECYFTYTDPSPLVSGYFGFRATASRQEIRNFIIHQLD